MQVIKVKQDGDDFYLDLHEILVGTNVKVEDVEYYKFEEQDNSLILTLYDKNKKQLEVNNEIN